MRIATRLTLLFVLLTLLVGLTVGWFAVAMASRADYATLDSSINAVVDSGLRNPNTALSNALYVVQRNEYDLTLDVIFPSGAITRVNTAHVPPSRRPTLADVKASETHVVSVSNLPGFEIRSLDVGGGDYLIVAGSTSGIKKRDQHLALVVVAAALVIALIAFGLARQVMARDLRSMRRLINYAGDVASNDGAGTVPPNRGSRDLRELRDALTKMVESLQERIALEQRSALAMQEFIDDASHELRTPLTVVKGYNDMLATGQMSDEQRDRAISRVRSEVQRMEDLVRDLLLLAELREAPQHAVERVDLSELLEMRLDEFALDHQDHPLESDVAAGVCVRGRRDFVERLIGNALSNVVRHTETGTSLRVKLSERAGTAELLIEDAGPGLPQYGQRTQSFKRFDPSRSRDTGGSGLGMSMMADVAESLGGSMTTEKSELGGLGLRFVLPLGVRSD